MGKFYDYEAEGGTPQRIADVVNSMSNREVREALSTILSDEEITVKPISEKEKRDFIVIYNIKSGAVLQKPQGEKVFRNQQKIACRELQFLQEILKIPDDREKLIQLLIFIWDELYYLHASSIYSDIALDYILQKNWVEIRDDLQKIIREYLRWII